MKRVTLSVLVLTALLFATCKSDTAKTDQQAGSAEETSSSPVKAGKFGIKSGIIEYTANMMNMDMNQVITFDDYGSKQITETLMEVVGQKVHTGNLIKGDYVYTLDYNNKTATKSRFYGAAGADIDFRNLSKEMESKMNLRKLGKEEFFGKKCDKYSIDYTDMKMKGTFLVWEGIALKSDIDMGTMKMVLVVKNLQENVNVPADKFEVPADYTITEQ